MTVPIAKTAAGEKHPVIGASAIIISATTHLKQRMRARTVLRWFIINLDRNGSSAIRVFLKIPKKQPEDRVGGKMN
jgi:hypothetical protein